MLLLFNAVILILYHHADLWLKPSHTKGWLPPPSLGNNLQVNDSLLPKTEKKVT